MNRTLFSLLLIALGLGTTVAKAQDRNYSNRGYQNGDRNYQQNDNYSDRNNRNDDYSDRNNRNNNYNDRDNRNDDFFARCDNNRYGRYDFDARNPFDTRSPNYDPRNPFDPRPVYDPYRHSRWNEIDFRSNADPFDFCENRRVWASRYFPLDPSNPYDIRNRYMNQWNNNSYAYGRGSYGRDYGRRRQAPAVIIVPVPAPRGYGHDHYHRRNW